MNYSKIYNLIINERIKNPSQNIYIEKHHILPRSLGGSDNINNLVSLSAKEHFICHRLLEKIYKDEPIKHRSMIHALFMMMNTRKDKIYQNSRQYQVIKEKVAKYHSQSFGGHKNPNFGKIWITNGISDKMIKSFTFIENGWRHGRTNNMPAQTTVLKEKSRNTKIKQYGQLYSSHITNIAWLEARSENRRKQSKPFICLDTNEIFNLKIDAARKFGCNKSQITKVLKGTQKTAAKKRFRYVDDI